jgi:hypothetical protein
MEQRKKERGIINSNGKIEKYITQKVVPSINIPPSPNIIEDICEPDETWYTKFHADDIIQCHSCIFRTSQSAEILFGKGKVASVTVVFSKNLYAVKRC